MAELVRIYPYLYFNGEAEAALQFYTQALQARVNALIRFHEVGGDFPAGMEMSIMHAEIEFGENCMMLCDSPYEQAQPGNNFAMSINIIDDIESASTLFAQLADSGTTSFPFQVTQWGAYCGMVTDRFGIRWMVNCRPSAEQPG